MNGDRADKVPLESVSLPLDAVIERYWTYLRIARGLSQNTLLAYQRDVTNFQRYLRDQGLHEAQEVSPPLLADFLQHLHRSGLAPSSRARSLAAIRSLFHFLKQEGIVSA